MKLRFTGAARRDVVDAHGWYIERNLELGDRFLAETESGVNRIMEHPDAWHSVGDGARRFSLNNFPYGIIYTVVDDEIIVVAVAHHSRKPGYWRSRL